MNCTSCHNQYDNGNFGTCCTGIVYPFPASYIPTIFTCGAMPHSWPPPAEGCEQVPACCGCNGPVGVCQPNRVLPTNSN